MESLIKWVGRTLVIENVDDVLNIFFMMAFVGGAGAGAGALFGCALAGGVIGVVGALAARAYLAPRNDPA